MKRLSRSGALPLFDAAGALALALAVACGACGASSPPLDETPGAGSGNGSPRNGSDAATGPSGPTLGETNPTAPGTTPGVESGCDGKLTGVALDGKGVVRSSWQYHPGTTFTDFGGVPGYPCRAFDFAKLPPMSAPEWTNAPSGKSIAFHETSTFCATPPIPQYSKGQFRYFRTAVWIPKAGPGGNVEIVADDIDDSLKVYIFNSRHPAGVSPDWSGNPENAAMGVCQGNGTLRFDLAPVLVPGELNGVMLAHADLNCAVSSLGSVNLFTNLQPIDIVGCPGAKDVPPPK